MKKMSLIVVASLSLCLSACISNEELALADNVETALPNEVKNCTFIADVDTNTAYPNISIARKYLKLKSYELGATHLVQTFAYPVQMGFYCDFGIALTGRAYKCPVSKNTFNDNHIFENKNVFSKDKDVFDDKNVFEKENVFNSKDNLNDKD